MILADKIVLQRKKNGWSQEELSEKLGVTRQSVSKWEGAQAIPDLQRLLQMSQIFGVSTDYLLKDELEEDENTYEEVTDDTDMPLRRVSMEEANRFLEVKRRTAPRIALATFMCMLSPISLFLLAAASETEKLKLSENAACGIGMIVLLLFVAAAVAIFISCGMKTKEYEYLETELIETEYGVSSAVMERKKQYGERYTRYNICGTTLCILGVLPLFIGMAITENEMILVCMLCLLLVVEGIGVMFFINAGIIQASFQKLLQEEDYSVERKRSSKWNQAVGTVYWLVITAAFLGYSFITNDWGRSWIIWPVAGVLFPAVLAIRNMMRD